VKNAPTLWTLKRLVDYVNKGECLAETKTEGWVPARPLGYYSLSSRVKIAWKVFRGQADAVTWPTDRLKADLDCKWIDDGSDGYGKSWHCDACGKCVFYEQQEPTKCIKDTDATPYPGWRKKQITS